MPDILQLHFLVKPFEIIYKELPCHPCCGWGSVLYIVRHVCASECSWLPLIFHYIRLKNCAPIHICAKCNCDALFGLFGAPGCLFTPMHQTFARLELPKEIHLVHVKNLPWSEITHPVAYCCLCIFHHIIRDICCLAMDTNVTDSMPRPEVLHPMHSKL